MGHKIATGLTSMESKRKRLYGVTPEQYDEMLRQQGHACAICNVDETQLLKALAVDHDHKTGKVRGLLCINCNVVLGSFKDDVAMLRSALQYLVDSA